MFGRTGRAVRDKLRAQFTGRRIQRRLIEIRDSIEIEQRAG